MFESKMKFNRLSPLALGLAGCLAMAGVAGAQDEAAPTTPAATEKPADNSSYYIGLSIGEQMRAQEFTENEIDVASLAMGLADVLAGRDLRLSEEEIARLAVNRHRFPGVEIQAQLTRHYPLGAEAVHAVGYVGRINAQELEQLDATNYRGTTHIGKSGGER